MLEKQNPCFRVGFGRVCITPHYSVPLGGYGNTSTRMSDNCINPLYTTCIAFTDAEENTVLLFHNDLQTTHNDIFTPIQETISKVTGVPFENIMITATHTHSGPDLWNLAEPSIYRYRASLPGWMVEAAVAAMEDRKSAKMYIGRTICPRMNFGRHYLLSDGSYCGPSFGDPTGKEYVRHAVEVDNSMQVIKFTRQGGKDVVLVNWQTHPSRTGGSKRLNIASDVIGVIRDICEEKQDCLLAYFSGASGNVEIKSRIAEENIAFDVFSHGEALASHALTALASVKPVETGKVKTITRVHTGVINHSEDHKVEAAREIYKLWRETNDPKLIVEKGKPFGINSGYHAGSIISKSKLGKTENLEISAFSLGDVGFAVASYEMFDANGRYIKEHSPFAMTFVATCSRGNNGYIPSAFFYELDCYERNNCKFLPGIGEDLAEQFVDMLCQLRDGQERA